MFAVISSNPALDRLMKFQKHMNHVPCEDGVRGNSFIQISARTVVSAVCELLFDDRSQQ
jgi:hypothetical protein